MSDETSVGSGANEPTVTSNPTPTVTVEAIAATLKAEKPAVQEHAIAQAEAEAAAAEGKDSGGNSFNPAIHAVNADGTPRKTVTGRYALKRGKKANSSADSKNSQSVKTGTAARGIVLPGAPAQASATEQEARIAGAGAANMFFAVRVGVGGTEWAPRIDEKSGMNEKVMMEHAAGDYFAAKGWGDLPPGLALFAAVCMYALPRLSMPQTKTRMQRFRIWIGSKIGAWRASRLAKKRGFPETDVERADRHAREKFERERDGHG
jgi:hypothetical protein